MLDPNRLLRLALVAIATASFAGCDSGGSGFDSITPAEPVEVALTRIDVSPGAEAAVVVPMDVQFTAIGTYSDGSTADLTASVDWTSSDESVAAISNEGPTRGFASFGAAGLTEITATDPASGVSGAVGLLAGAIALDITPLDASILIGSTLQMTATVTLGDVDETPFDVTSVATWTSSDETVATISAGGLVTAAALGTTMITAVDPLSGQTATTSVIVTDVLGLSYVSLSRGSIIGGGSVGITGTVVLTAITDEDFELTLWSTNDLVMTVPGSVVVPAGADRVSFDVGTVEVPQKTRVFVWASDGLVEKRASLNVRKPKRQL
jgi:hypothetical protein